MENELNEDVDAPCSDLVKKLSQGSRSMDSVLTLSDYDLDQPEVEGLLTLSDFDLNHSKDEDIQMGRPLESKPVDTAVYTRVPRAQAPSGVSTPSRLSTAAADAPKGLRRDRRCSEPSIDYLDSKLSYLREFYQKKLRKSSCDAILSKKDESHLNQNQPLQEGGKTCFKKSLVTGTDSKKNAPSKSVKKKSLSDNEGSHVKHFPKSKPVAISVASYSHMSSCDHPRSQPFDTDTSEYSPPHTADALKSSRRQRRCSEPSIDDQHCRLTYLRGIYPKQQQKASYEASLLHGEEDYLKRHKSLQMEGQKLINQSLVMGIEVGKSSAANQSAEKVLPPRLNLCSRTSYSSLSSPGTSPSGSSLSSQDSAFSQISEHSVFAPTETSSPIDCTFQRKQAELSSDFSSSGLISGIPGPSSGQASGHLAYTKKDSVEWHSHMHSVTLHPSTWLKSGVASLKNWSLKKKARAPRPEESKAGSLKGPTDPPAHASGLPEAVAPQERQKDMPQRAAEGLGAVQTARWYSSYPSQDSEKPCSTPFSLMEDRLGLRMKSPEEGEDGGQCSPGMLPQRRSSPAPLTVDDASSPGSGLPMVCDAEDGHLAKDI